MDFIWHLVMISISFHFSYFRPKLSHFSLAFISSFAFYFPNSWNALTQKLGWKTYSPPPIFHRNILLLLIRFCCQCKRRHHIGSAVRISKSKCEKKTYWGYQRSNIVRSFQRFFVTEKEINFVSSIKSTSIFFRFRVYSFFFFFDFATTLIHFLHWLANQYHFHLKYRINFHSFHSHQLEIVLLFAFSWHVYMVIVLLVSDCDNIIAIKSKTIQCIISIGI